MDVYSFSYNFKQLIYEKHLIGIFDICSLIITNLLKLLLYHCYLGLKFNEALRKYKKISRAESYKKYWTFQNVFLSINISVQSKTSLMNL